MLFSKAIIGKLCKDIEISYLVEMAQEVEKIDSSRKTFCKIIGRCGENVGKIGYKNGLQVSVGHLCVPGAGIEPARIAPLVFETSASTDSAIRAGVLFCSLSPGLKEAREG